MNKTESDPHVYLRGLLDQLAENTSSAIVNLSYDSLLERVLEQKNVVIAELQQAAGQKEEGVKKLQALQAESARKIQAAQDDLVRAFEGRDDLVRAFEKYEQERTKSVLAARELELAMQRTQRHIELVATTTKELLRRRNYKRFFRAMLPGREPARGLVTADNIQSRRGIWGWTVGHAMCDPAGWYIRRPSRERGVAADLLIETASTGIHEAYQDIAQIAGHSLSSVCVLLRPHGRDFAAICVESGVSHRAEGCFDLGRATLGRAYNSGDFADVKAGIERYSDDWLACKLQFKTPGALERASIRIQVRQGEGGGSDYAGVAGLGIGVADIHLGYSRPGPGAPR